MHKLNESGLLKIDISLILIEIKIGFIKKNVTQKYSFDTYK